MGRKLLKRIGKTKINGNRGRLSALGGKTAVGMLALGLAVAACGSSTSVSSTNTGASTTKSVSTYVLHAMVSETGSAAWVRAAEKAAFKGAQDYVNSTGALMANHFKYQ